MIYIRVYRSLIGLPKGLYQIAEQDKEKRMLVLQEVNGSRKKRLTVDAFERLRAKEWLDFSLNAL